MLKQILREMHIAPEILAELSDEQKLLLFCKMREEQIRRYEEQDKQWEKEQRKKKGKAAPRTQKIGFLKGADGKDWVWVMGDHPTDESIEHILQEEAIKNATVEAEKEAEAKRQEEEEELQRLQQEQERLQEEERRRTEEIRRKKEEAARLAEKEQKKALKQLEEERRKAETDTIKRRKELKNREESMMKRTLERKKKTIERRSSQIFTNFQEARAKFIKLAEQDNPKLDRMYRERESTAKAEEEKRRSMARIMREEHRRSSMLTAGRSVMGAQQAVGGLQELYQDALKLRKTSTPYLKENNQGFLPRPTVSGRKNDPAHNNTRAPLSSTSEEPPSSSRPPSVSSTSSIKRPSLADRQKAPASRAAVVEWFREAEAPKVVGKDPSTGEVWPWFHGVISRIEAEHLLQGKPVGAYLVRVSERIWGYAVSVKGKERTKHFLVDTTDDVYQFFGTNQLVFTSLLELVKHHQVHPVSIMGKETLIVPVSQPKKSSPNYAELFATESTSL